MTVKKLLVFMMVILLVSCSRNDDLYNANKKIVEMKSYSAQADITVYGNKGVSKYKEKHLFCIPDKVRIETVEPDFLKGKILVSADGKCSIYHPLISQSFEISSSDDTEHILLLYTIQKSLLSSENAQYSHIKKNGTDYIRIKAKLADSSNQSISILLSAEDYIPVEAEIYDLNGNVSVRIDYTDFKYNVKTNDSQFKM